LLRPNLASGHQKARASPAFDQLWQATGTPDTGQVGRLFCFCCVIFLTLALSLSQTRKYSSLQIVLRNVTYLSNTYMARFETPKIKVWFTMHGAVTENQLQFLICLQVEL
jgi:hypothetical protein